MYLENFPPGAEQAFRALHDAELSTADFNFYSSVASVFSSKIEGEDIELDSYIKHKRFGIEFLPDYTKKIDDLYEAYTFAQEQPLTPVNIAAAHSLLSRHIVTPAWQGKFRTQHMYVTTPDGKIEYVAASPFEVEAEMYSLQHDIELLLKADMGFAESFFYASMIHLVFVKIHPWNDGNGRSARLLEKWFLAAKLEGHAWFLQSEKHYYEQHQQYYSNLRKLGLEYAELDYSQSLPFLLMLPGSLQISIS